MIDEIPLSTLELDGIRHSYVQDSILDEVITINLNENQN